MIVDDYSDFRFWRRREGARLFGFEIDDYSDSLISGNMQGQSRSRDKMLHRQTY